jgi:hypothetical protein
MRRRTNRRRPFEVRWHVGGRGRSRSFITWGLADSYRAELVRAARQGLAFDPVTGEPAAWAAAPEAAGVTWHEHAVAYGSVKWPHAAAHTRAGIADALATITPALVTTAAGRPPASVLRAALYAHAYNPSRPAPPAGTAVARALAWAERHSLPLADLQDPQVARRALDALTVPLDGCRAAATTITRKRAVLHGAGGYAVELGLLAADPLDTIRWKAPATALAADRRAVASPAQVQAILDEVSRSRPELTAFFGCLYLAALRPEEAVALREDCCHLAAFGWGLLIIDTAAPRTAAAWTSTGASHEHRGLKQRPEGATRAIPYRPTSSASWPSTSAPTAPQPTGGCSAAPAAASSARAPTAAPGTPPAPPPSDPALPTPLSPAAPTTCATPPCPSGSPPAYHPRKQPPAPGTAPPSCTLSTLTPSPARKMPPTPSSTAPCTHRTNLPAITARLPAPHTAPGWPAKPPPGPSGPVRPASASQRDPAGPRRTPDTVPPPSTCPLNCTNTTPGRPQTPVEPYRARRPGQRPRRPLTCPDLAHGWPTSTASGLPNRSRTSRRPGHREHRNRV